METLYLTIDENLKKLELQYHLKIEYSDIPILSQHIIDLLDKIDKESLFVLNDKTISILSEIRENGKCFCFCIEVDVSNGYPVSLCETYSILESDIKKTAFHEIENKELEQKLFDRFKEKSSRVRIELDNIVKMKKNTSESYNNKTTSSSQSKNPDNGSSQHIYENKNIYKNKNELEIFIADNSKNNKYYAYFIGCKSFSDVRKRRNELVKQFHPDMGNPSANEICYINPIYEEIKQNFGN